MQAEDTSTLADLKLPVSIDMRGHRELRHVHGFLERDLRPESLWMRSTSLTCIPCDSVGNGASSSSIDGEAVINNLGGSSSDPIEVLRASDIENNVEFFLGPANVLLRKMPAARPFSKVASLANEADYDEWLNPVALPNANNASSGSGLHTPLVQQF